MYLGQTGAGKTFLAKKCLHRAERPIFILDSMNEFPSMEPGDPAPVGLVFRSVAQLKRYLISRRENATGVYSVKVTQDHEAEAFFKLMVDLGEGGQEGMTCVVDETSKFCSPSSIDDNLARMIRYGRHWGQNLMFVSRRPQEVHRDVTAQADCLVVFSMAENRDVDYIEKRHEDGELVRGLSKTAHDYAILGEWRHLPFADVLDSPKRVTHPKPEPEEEADPETEPETEPVDG